MLYILFLLNVLGFSRKCIDTIFEDLLSYGHYHMYEILICLQIFFVKWIISLQHFSLVLVTSLPSVINVVFCFLFFVFPLFQGLNLKRLESVQGGREVRKSKGEGWRRREGIHIYGVPTVCSELFLVYLISCNPHNMTKWQIAKSYSVRIWTHISLTSKSSFHQTKIENSHGSEQGYMEAETKETNLRL